jgi:hypothetical protein
MIAGLSVETVCEAVVLVSEPGPWVGLPTGACTERAVTAEESTGHLGALAVPTVGLGNPVAAGLVVESGVRAALDPSIRDWQERHR